MKHIEIYEKQKTYRECVRAERIRGKQISKTAHIESSHRCHDTKSVLTSNTFENFIIFICMLLREIKKKTTFVDPFASTGISFCRVVSVNIYSITLPNVFICKPIKCI